MLTHMTQRLNIVNYLAIARIRENGSVVLFFYRYIYT